MNEDILPMFPDEERPPGRYVARRRVAPWSAREDAIVVTVLSSVGSIGAALRTAEWLCGLFGRMPAYAAGDRPTKQRTVTDCHDLLEARRWKLVADHPDAGPPNLGMARDHLPRTWGESVLFIRPWYMRRREHDVIGLAALGLMLGRVDLTPLTKYVGILEANLQTEDPDDVGVDPKFLRGLETDIKEFLAAPHIATAAVAFGRIKTTLYGR